MPTKIDELVVELGLDASKFTQGQREALDAFRRTEASAARSGHEIEGQGRRSVDYFAGLKREAVGLLSVFLGGEAIKSFVGHMTNADAATGRISKTINMNVRELSAWEGAFEQIGGSADSAKGALQGISAALQLPGITGDVPLFARFIGGLYDQNHKLKDSGEVIKELADTVHNMGLSGATAATFLSRVVPGINQDTINLILEGRDAIDGYLKKAREAEGVTEESAAATAKYQASLALLDRSATSLGRTLLTGLIPVLTTVMDIFTALFKGNIDLWGEKTKVPPEVQKELEDRHERLTARFGRPFWDKVRPETSTGTPDAVLPLKPGAMAGGPASAGTLALARAIQASVPELRQVTAMNDRFHAGTGSKHAQGLALDFTINGQDPRAAAAGIAARVRAQLAGAGIRATVLDEYNHPSPRSTGGHIHVQFRDEAEAQAYARREAAVPRPAARPTPSPAASPGNTAASADPWSGWRGVPFPGVGGPLGRGEALPGAVAAAGVRAGSSVRSSSSTSSTEVNIGTVNVNAPQAKDAGGVARELPAAVRRVSWAAGANTGPA